jgi:trimeric autotransporter adhesin
MALRNRICLQVLLLVGTVALGKSQTLQGSIDSPLDGQINALAVSGSKVYMGGTFTRFGYSCGTGVLLDTSTAQPDRSFPKCDPLGGQILASVPDGMGGYYIGGQFTYINGIARKYLAHIRSDHSLDSLNPNPSSYVTTLSLSGKRLYVGGTFTTIAGQSRGHAAAFDTASGSILAWDPQADDIVTAIQQVGNLVYLGGYFNNLGAQSRFLIGSVDTASGTPTSWNPSNSGFTGAHVTQFIYTGTYLYACGPFLQINGFSRNCLVKMDAVGNVITGWNPGINFNGGSSTVMTMVLSGGYLYVGGSFTSIGGITVNNLAAIDLVTGAASGWNPNPNNTITSITATGGAIYVGGNFSTIGGRSINNLAKIDTGSGLAYTWDAKLYNYPATSVPYTLSTDGKTIFAGGSFNGVGSTTRNGLGAIDLTTGRVTSWNPNVTLAGGLAVYAIALAGDKVIAGGSFTFIAGHSISYLAAVDTLNGSAVLSPSWLATANSYVQALKVFGDRLYIGGYFNGSRHYLEAVSKYDGTLLPWTPVLDNPVFSIATSGSKVFVGGMFANVGATPRNNAAAFDTTSDSLT